MQYIHIRAYSGVMAVANALFFTIETPYRRHDYGNCERSPKHTYWFRFDLVTRSKYSMATFSSGARHLKHRYYGLIQIFVLVGSSYEVVHYWNNNTLCHGYSCDYSQCLCSNSLRPSDVIRRQRSGSTSAQVMVCCLTIPSYYLNQYWLSPFFGWKYI